MEASKLPNISGLYSKEANIKAGDTKTYWTYIQRGELVKVTFPGQKPSYGELYYDQIVGQYKISRYWFDGSYAVVPVDVKNQTIGGIGPPAHIKVKDLPSS
jgi:hypothetical protein